MIITWNKSKETRRFLFSFVCIRRSLSIFAVYFNFNRLNLELYHRFSDDCYFSAFIYRANLHSSFINFILYRLFFWHDKFNILFCEKGNKITCVQSHVVFPLVIKVLKLLFRDDIASNFNFLIFALLFRFRFSDSRTSEKSFFFEFYFYCCYFVSIVSNPLFLFFIYRI